MSNTMPNFWHSSCTVLLMHYDQSTKEYEIQRNCYTFLKSTRTLKYKSNWNHWKYYATEQQANDALRDLRRGAYKRDIDFGPDWPKLVPVFKLDRFRVVKRNLARLLLTSE